jgi:nucleoside triphosphate diphosphatase
MPTDTALTNDTIPHADRRQLATLVTVMAALRTPVTGCPWDLEQSFATIAPYTIEEAYEVADAIARGDLLDLRDELGDLLLQVVYHARLAEEQGTFALPDVIASINAKMIRRHPHVFGNEQARSAWAAKGWWEAIKAQEKAAKASERARQAPASIDTGATASSVLDDVPTAMPALTRAIKLQDKAARVGFDWPSVTPVLAKVREEVSELEAEIAGGHKARAQEEFGDLMLWSPTWRAILKLIPRPACVRPMTNSNAAFRALSACLPNAANAPINPISPRWTHFGTR